MPQQGRQWAGELSTCLVLHCVPLLLVKLSVLSINGCLLLIHLATDDKAQGEEAVGG